jgi:putative glutamine amidotransferase
MGRLARRSAPVHLTGFCVEFTQELGAHDQTWSVAMVAGRRRSTMVPMSTSIPLIAVPGRLSADATNVRGEAFAAGQRYLRAIGRAGGHGVVVPPIVDDLEQVIASMDRFDGLVLHGGGDLDPTLYGEQPSAEQLYGIVADHDVFELAVLRAALDRDIPILAICRGMQVLNVALGGTLNQHIGNGDAGNDDTGNGDTGNDDHWHTYHAVEIEADSRLAAALQTTRPQACHSVHHQALKAVAAGLRIVATARDGTIEGVEYDARSWVVGVQWHPEDTAATDAVQQHLFEAFISSARNHAAISS